MNERTTYVSSEAHRIADDARSAFGSFSSEQLNWKPGEGQWSIAQCLDHLIRSNDGFVPDLEALGTGTRKTRFFEKWSPLSGVMGRFLIKAVTDDSKKAKAPTKKVVPPSDLGQEIVENFCGHLESIGDKVRLLGNVDERRTVLTSPIVPIFTYSLDDAYTVIIEHSNRHIRQAKRVMAADGFPK